MPPKQPRVFSVAYEEVEIRTVVRRKRMQVRARSASEASRLVRKIATEDLTMAGVQTEGLIRVDQIGAPCDLGSDFCARNFQKPEMKG